MKKFLQLFICFVIYSATGNSQTVSLAKTVFAPGEKIIVSFSGFAGNPKDWISIAAPGTTDDKYIVWVYTNGSRNGTVTFDGIAYGNYEIRGYFNNESFVRARTSFRVGNADGNISAKTTRNSYTPYEKITVQYSGMPGNSRDWISLSKAGSADGQYVSWFYTEGKQSSSMDFNGIAEGSYEVRSYFNGENTVRSRQPFTVSNVVTGGTGAKLCKTELSVFYSGMNALGLAWGRLGSDVFMPVVVSEVQASLGNAVAGLNSIPCLAASSSKVRNFSSKLPSLTKQQAITEIDQLIREIQDAISRANITCDKNGSLMSLFTAGVHLGAAQAIASTFMCRMIPADWQTNISNHLATARSGLAGFSACLPGINLSLFGTVPVSAGNAYEPLSVIIGIHIQVLWAVSLSDCCCYCK